MFLSLSFKDFDERGPDDLALFLGIADVGKTLDKLIGRVDHHQIQRLPVFSGKCCLYFLTFVFSQQAIIDKYAHELFANRSREQGRHHARVNAA